MCSELRLVDEELVRVFYVQNMMAHVEIYLEPMDAGAVPGSVTMSDTEKDGVTAKEINFKCELTRENIWRLTRLRTKRLIAYYRDALGRERVCGSPTWPLTLGFTAESDGLNVTLRGSDTGPDPYREG